MLRWKFKLLSLACAVMLPAAGCAFIDALHERFGTPDDTPGWVQDIRNLIPGD